MATTKGKKGMKKSARLEKGKALRQVKPLTEISLNFGNVKYDYKPQTQ